MGTRTPLFCDKLAEKNEVKDYYPLEKGQNIPQEGDLKLAKNEAGV